MQQNVLIASIENDGILGMDFLTTHHCDLMLTQLCMKLNDEKIRCFPNSREAQPTCCRVAISEYVEIPPETEVVVQGFVTGTIDRKKTRIVEKKGTSRQRSGKGAIRKRFPLQKPRWEKNKLTIRYLYHETIVSRMGSYFPNRWPLS